MTEIFVMAGLDPAIHVFLSSCTKDVDARLHRRAEATPFFERLWPGMTSLLRGADSTDLTAHCRCARASNGQATAA